MSKTDTGNQKLARYNIRMLTVPAKYFRIWIKDIAPISKRHEDASDVDDKIDIIQCQIR